MSTVLAPPQRSLPAPEAAPDPRPGRLAAWLVRWRLALRLARRDARRARARTVLVLLMVGLPVMAIVGADTLNRTNDLSAVEALPSRLGAADARLEGVSREPIVADPLLGEPLSVQSPTDEPWTADELRAALPDGAQLVEQRAGMVALRTGIGYATVEAFAEDAAHPLRNGAYAAVEGRTAVRDGEVAVSEAVARRGIEVGDRVRLTRDDVAVEVVGVLRSDAMPGSQFVVLPPEAVDLIDNGRTLFFADVPGGLDWPAVQQLNEQGLAALSRVVLEDPPAPEEYLPPEWGDTGASSAEIAVIALVVAALLLEVVLLAGPAFAVGLRRQRRDLALLAAAGGTPADLRRAVLASGLLLGGGAAVAGALAGVAGARAAVPVFESRGAGFGPFEVSPLTVAAVVGVGAVAGLAASYVPARQAARTDVVTTLTGRRGQVRSSWRLPVVGLVVAAAGLALTVLGAQGTELAVAGGAVLLVVGVVVATPWLVGQLSPLGARLPVAGRLAVRDATRNRARTAPAVAAVMATVAGVTAMAIGSASDSAQGERDYVPSAPMGMATVSVFDADQEGWAAVRSTVEQRLPARDVSEIRGIAYLDPDAPGLQVTRPGCTAGPADCAWYPAFDQQSFMTTLGELAVGEPAAIAAVAPAAVRAEVLAALEAGRVVVFGPDALDAAGQVRLDGVRYTEQGTDLVGDGVSLPATEVVPPATGTWITAPANIAVPVSLADRLPVPTAITQLVVGDPDDPLTDAEETTLRESVALLSSESSVYVERGWSDELWVARLLLLAVGGTLVLVATLTATGLAVADARPDHATLAAVGAAPRTRRLMAMGSAAVIGGLGAALGVLAGLAPGIAVAYPLTSTDYGSGAQPLVVVPWNLLAAIAVGVPLLAVLVTGLVVRSRLPMVTRIAG